MSKPKDKEEFRTDPWRDIFADQFNKRWLKYRKNVLAKNMETEDESKVDKEVDRQLSNLEMLNELHRVDSSSWDLPIAPHNFQTKVADRIGKRDDVAGFYVPLLHTAVYDTDRASTIVHERAHASDPKPQIKAIEKKVDEGLKPWIEKDEYWDNPNEIHSRLMSLRHKYGLDPTKTYTREEIEELSGKAVFDDDIRELFNRYTVDFIYYLINDVAQHPLEKINQTPIVRFGGKLFGIVKKI